MSADPFIRSAPLLRDSIAERAALIARWGDGAASEAIFDPLCELFRDPMIEGVIGYRILHGYAVVFGHPLAPLQQRYALRSAFETYCRDHGWQSLDIVVDSAWRESLLALDPHSLAFQFGEEVLFNPVEYLHQHLKGSLRGRLNIAQRAGISVKEYVHEDPQIERAMVHLAETWLAVRQGPQIYYLHVDLFAQRVTRRWFFAQQNDEIVGLVTLDMVQGSSPSSEGWMMHYIMAAPTAPPGTTELLVDQVLRALSLEGCRLLSCAIVPTTQLSQLRGLYPWFGKLVQWTYSLLRNLFNLCGRSRYWKKFPATFCPMHILAKGRWIPPSELYALLQALNVEIFK